MKIKRIIYKIRLKLCYITNNLICLFKINSKKRLFIVSSLKYQNKVKADLYLQKFFLKNNYYCKIITWQDKITNEYCLISSVWGYCQDLDNFLKFVTNNKTINAKEIIYNNISKKKQYELLEKYNIPRITTKFYENSKDFKFKDKKQVVKPAISESGNNTYIIENKKDLDKIKDLASFSVQPFISGIEEGELSLIVLDKKLKYGVIRYPGIFSKYEKEKYVKKEDIPYQAFNIFNDVINIKEYSKAKYMRIDLVKDKDTYKVLELELVDPDLFIESIPDEEFKKEIYKEFVTVIDKYLIEDIR